MRAMPERKSVPPRIDMRCPKCGARAAFRRDSDAGLDPDQGECQCDQCVSRFPHRLAWPHDAYWRLAVRGHDLWAHNEQELRALLDYAAAGQRDLRRFPTHADFLRRVPRALLSAKLRGELTHRLQQMLDARQGESQA
jgi:hypothetical protein